MTVEFKKDDRVAVYSNGITWEHDRRDGSARQDKGVIIGISEKGLTIFFDGAQVASQLFWHPKQCRKLKPPRKPQEIWVPVLANYDLDCVWYINGTEAFKKSPVGRARLFREVRTKS